MSFQAAYDAERCASSGVRRAYIRRRRVEWRLGNSDDTRAVAAAVERMRRIEDDACDRHEAAAERLAILWDRLSTHWAPADILTEARSCRDMSEPAAEATLEAFRRLRTPLAGCLPAWSTCAL